MSGFDYDNQNRRPIRISQAKIVGKQFPTQACRYIYIVIPYLGKNDLEIEVV